MTTITKEQALAVSDLKAGYTLGHADVSIMKEIARIALASLEAEPVAIIDVPNLDYLAGGMDATVWPLDSFEHGDVMLYATPIAPVVQEPINSAGSAEKCRSGENVQVAPPELHWDDVCRTIPWIKFGDTMVYAIGWNACRAAMLRSSGE